MKILRSNNSGFTFIEVMIATVIFVMAALAAMDLARGSVRAVKDAQDVTMATWLLQKVIVELETRLESEGIEKACEKKKEGTFEPPHEKFSYVTYCSEIDFRLSEEASKILGEGAEEQSDNAQTINLYKKQLLEAMSKYISTASREIHAEVSWMQGKTPRVIDVTTHFVNYGLPIPNLQ
ncbi:MAG: prepilin-type N-terminal cleavage/methylation domain-containing protein [Proteobacteria bacterium]|nr:prepilin-type N-terminal cleavage/methylation domain-containing protein [Pseudomonadota bacterium]